MTEDERFMTLAIAEASRALGKTHPNPAVGAVLVKGGKVIAVGHHERAGMAHAEVAALEKQNGKAAGATMYVTLEPCNHLGKTPPCCDAILEAKVRRVVFGSSDPNPLVNGRGVRRLRSAGVEVVSHVMQKECDALNRPFFKVMRTGLPWVTLKVASTLDGKMATQTRDSRWISSEASRRRVHELRGQVDAVLVGAGTVLADNPQLTARIPNAKNPVRVVLAGTVRLPKRAKVFSKDARTIVVDRMTPMKRVLRSLAQEGLLHVLVEGGSEVHCQFLRSGLFDELWIFAAPKLIGAEGVTWSGNLNVNRIAKAQQLKLESVERIGDDVLLKYTR